MSDGHAAKKLFNQTLSEYHADILPDDFVDWSEDWSELGDKEKDKHKQLLLWLTLFSSLS